MKKLLSIVGLLLICASAHAQAVNNRVFGVDPPNAAEGITAWRIYCGTQNIASSLTSLVKESPAGTVTGVAVALPDTVKFCAAKWVKGTLEGATFSNIVDVVPPASAPVMRITTIETFSWDPATGRGALLDRVATAELVTR